MVRLLFLAIIFFALSTGYGQEDQAARQLSLGVDKALAGDYRVAAEHYATAREIYLKRNDVHQYVHSEFLVLDCLLNSSELISCAQRLKGLEQFIEAHAVDFRTNFLDTANTSLALFRIEFLNRTGNVAESIRVLKNLQSLFSQQNAERSSSYIDQRLIQVSLMLANAYSLQGDCENTRAFAIQSLSSMEKYRNVYVDDGVMLQPYLLLARCYTSEGDTSKARSTYNNVLNLLNEVSGKKSQRTFRAFVEIFEYYLQSHMIDSAQHYLNRLSGLVTDAQKGEWMMHQGDLHYTTGNTSGAEAAYRNALSIINKQRGYQNEALAECYMSLGHVARRENKANQALQYYQLGLFRMSRETMSNDNFQNPSFSSLFRQRNTLKILHGKAVSLTNISQEANRWEYLDAAWKTLRLTIRLIEDLRTGYHAESDKSLLIEDSYPVFEEAIDLCFYLNALQPTNHWLDSALLLMEESKALNLRDAVLHGQARKFSGIPAELLDYENTLRHEIAGKEIVLLEYRKSPVYSEATELSLLGELNAKKTEYQQLLQRYEKEHPRYYELKHKPIRITIPAVQAALSSGQSMHEYFVGDSAIYLLLIGPEDQQLHKIPKDFSLDKLVLQYRNSISAFALDKSNASLVDFFEVSGLLYKKLFPVETLPKSLLIVPDGVLGYISFSSLLKTNKGDSKDPRSLDYVLGHSNISYSYSATLFLDLRKSVDKAARNALICAPEFNGLPGVPPLVYNEQEGRMIRKATAGKLLSGSDCTIQSFSESLQHQSYSILHLATHGYANDEHGDASYLVFSATDPDSAFLYARDLYNLDLPLDLVYLSACETGTGELRRGEGLISLARGFFYAGIQSIVTTLWQVEDNRSQQLSSLFYAQLKNGERKDAAIANAQRMYIASLEPTEKFYAHPVYWSALIPVGNMDNVPISNSGIPGWLIWVLGLVGIILIVLVGKKLGKSNRMIR